MYIFILQLPTCWSSNFTEIFFKCVFLSGCRRLDFQPQRGSCRLWRGLGSSGSSGDDDPGGPRSAPSPGRPTVRPLRPSPGLPPQEGLDGQGDAAAAVLLLALGALPLHHDGGSWEFYCRTQRWLLASRRRRRLLPLLSPTLIPSFPEAEQPPSALIPRPSPLPQPLPARGTWLREEGRAGGTEERGRGRSEKPSASPPPRPLLAFSTSHCGQRPAPDRPAGDKSRGQVEQPWDGQKSPSSASHAGVLRVLFSPQNSASSPRSCTPGVSPVLLPNLGI